MNGLEIKITSADARKLLGAASGDAALLYIYLQSGNDPALAKDQLNMNESRVACALATLRQLGLWELERKAVVPGECPVYTEQDVLSAMETNKDFRALYGEVQHLLGRNLNTEELKIILSFVNYLGLSPEVVCMLVCYCKERARQKNRTRNPSLRTIEKEAFAWADRGIDTMEEASAFILQQNQQHSMVTQVKKAMQIYDRQLTPSEEKYVHAWLEMGFDPDAIAIAHDRACVNTGGRNWAYTNRILTRWHEAGIHTAQQVEERDRKPETPKGASGQLGAAELENIRKLMQEE